MACTWGSCFLGPPLQSSSDSHILTAFTVLYDMSPMLSLALCRESLEPQLPGKSKTESARDEGQRMNPAQPCHIILPHWPAIQPCHTPLPHCPTTLAYHNALPHWPATMPFHTALPHCPATLACHKALPHCPATQSCHTALPHKPAMLPCHTVLPCGSLQDTLASNARPRDLVDPPSSTPGQLFIFWLF